MKPERTEWWRALSAAERHGLNVRRGAMSRGVRGVWTEDGAEQESDVDFYEYLVNHEIVIDDGPRYHICSAEPAAREALRRGFVPADFACPREATSCPMRRILDLAPGRGLRLSVIG